MKEKITSLLAENIEGLSSGEIEKLIEIPPDPELGDYAFPCFRLAKELHKAPPAIAGDIRAAILTKAGIDPSEESTVIPSDSPLGYLADIRIKGAYINFFLNREVFIRECLSQLICEDFGASDEGKGKTICIDYSSPNVAKNFHVGHLRTTIIGNSLYKIFTKLGYNVERINHLGDWGTQFGKLIVAYKRWGDEEAVKEKGVEELMRLYVKFHSEAEKDDSLNDLAREWFHKMEEGDEEALKIWQWFVDISLKEYKRTYDLLGIDFDHFTGESFYRNMTGDVVQQLRDKNLLSESEGAEIVDLSEYDMPPCLILKKDGSSIYATRDIAAVFYRKRTYDFVKCLYVTGQEQKLHFSQVFKVAQLMGNDWAKDQLIHIPYGLVSLGGEKLSTRGGNIIYAEDILLEAVNKIKQIISEKNPDLPDKDEVSRIVGVGAVLFNDLYNQRIRDVSFKWDHLLNFDGETGPYVQYTYARCSSILRKIDASNDGISVETDVLEKIENGSISAELLTDPASIALIKEMMRMPSIIEDAAARYEPSVIARYAVDLAQAFNKFYTENKIAVDDPELRAARLSLVIITRRLIKESLSLLGIGVAEQM